MPTDIIQADYDELTAIANEFATEASGVDTLQRHITGLIDELAGGGWIGGGADAFYAEMDQDVLPGLTRLSGALNEASATIKEVSALIRSAEEEASQLFNGTGAGLFGMTGTGGQLGANAKNPGPTVTGTPNRLNKFWQLQTGPTCQLQAAQNILRAFGKNASIQDLWIDARKDDYLTAMLLDNPAFANSLTPAQRAALAGTPGGTYAEDGEQMLDANGVPSTRYNNGVFGIPKMLSEIEDGKAVIAEIDVKHLSAWGGQAGGHAVWVTGIERDADGDVINFIVNDSGHPNGQGIKYPVDQFLAAWSEMNFDFTSTDSPIPN